jgi:glycosyltransferase involved in cell wall biosynthesis
VAVRWSLRVPSSILVLSEHWRDVVAQLAPGRPIHVVPNGVEIPEVQPAPPGRDGALRVLTIGTLGRHKGHFEILDAAGLLRGQPVRFLLAGPDQTSGRGDGAELRRRAAELRLEGSVEFLGPVGEAEKADLLARADVFLLPSHAEGMPNAVLEAMAAALPVVVTPVGSLPEMLDGEGGRFIPVGEPAALAAALLELHCDASRRHTMGRWNRERAATRYSFARVVEQLDEIYRAREGG